jgi:putative redox protein
MPPVTLSLDWRGGMKFVAAADSPAIELDSGAPGITSPPQALAYAVMACMGMDVVDIIQKGRCTVEALTVRFDGVRAEEHPRRFVSMRVHFELTGNPADHIVARAIDLSREKYCSVWNSIRTDVELVTTFSVRPTGG